MSGINKSTKIEFDARVEEVLSLILSGYRRQNQIIHYISQKRPDWGVTDRQIKTYIRRARERIEEYSKVTRDEIIQNGLARLDMLFLRSLNVQDIKTALSVQKEIHDLTGVRAPQQHELSGKDGGPVEAKMIIEIVGDDEKDYDADKP